MFTIAPMEHQKGVTKTITAIETQKRRKSRANVFLDGGFGFGVSLAVIEEAGLRPGQIMHDSDIEELVRADLVRGCFDAALRYLSYRPRSEAELRTRLRRKFDDSTIEQVLLKLKEQRLMDDAAFAQFWKENRQTFSPRSRRLLKLELRRKGVDLQTVDEALAGLDDELNAYRAAQKRARSLSNLDYHSFRQRLGGFLQRRGFGYGVIGLTVERLWRERGQS